MTDNEPERDAFAEKLFRSALGYFDVLSIRLGQRLNLYDAISKEPATAEELAERAGIAERYAREWLEQQATAGILACDLTQDPVRFSLPPTHAEILLDTDSLSFMGASVSQMYSITNAFDHVVEAFRTGGGVPYDAYGADSVEGQGASNRPVFLNTLAHDWLPRIEPLHTRLIAEPAARIVDVGCGTGWSSIAVAGAYPGVEVDGFDPDEGSIGLARKNANAHGLEDRVRFHQQDAGSLTGGPFDMGMAFECIHDMSRPVEVLNAVRSSLTPGGKMLVMDERTLDRFTGEPDPIESYFYGWSVFDCLPAGMSEQPSAGTGTVMRASTLERYANEAGFAGFEVLPIEHDFFRLYLLST